MSQEQSQTNGGQGARNGVHGTNGGTFEQSYSRLQEVVQKLSAGNLTLQEALAAFEEGMQLADRCTRLLDEAELRVKQVSAKAARAGSEAMSELDEIMRQSPANEETPVVQMENYERRVVIEPGPATTTPGPARPASNQASRPGADRYAQDLELDPLFDDED